MIERINQSEWCIKGNRYSFNNGDGKYKTLFEQVNASVFLLTLSGNIIEANVKSYEMFDYEFGKFEHCHLSDLLSPTINLDERIEEIISQGGSTFEAIALKSDHTSFPVEINTSLFSIRNQPYILLLIQDISQRKHQEQKIHEQQQKYHRLFESTRDAMIILDARGEIIDINHRALKMTGIQKEDAVNKNLLNLGIFPEKALTILIEQFGWCLNKKQPASRHIKVRHKNGELFDVVLSSFFLYKEDEEIETFVVNFHDLREQQEFERELERTRSVLQLFFKHSKDAIYYKNKHNIFLLANMRTANLFDVSTEQIIGKTEYDFLPHEIASNLAEEDQNIMTHNTPMINKSSCLHLPYGISKEITTTKIPHLDDTGDIIGLLCIIGLNPNHIDACSE